MVAAAEASAEAFVLAATDGRRARAEALLAARPEIERDPWATLVLGRGWAGDPSRPGGPRGWPPIVYVSHSCFAPAALLRELLSRGADANATYRNEHGTMTALYGAAGIVHDPGMTRALLEAGADPDDGESVYHAVGAQSTACLALLLDHGASVTGTNALASALDEERLEHVRLLLDAGGDPNEGALLAHAVRRGRGPDVVRLLAERGADLDRPGGETWRGDVPVRTAYQHAVLRGGDDVAGVLAELGADTRLDPGDEAVAALARGRRPQAPLRWSACSSAAPTPPRRRTPSSPHRWPGRSWPPGTTSSRGATTSPSRSCSRRRATRSSRASSTSPTARWRSGWSSARPSRASARVGRSDVARRHASGPPPANQPRRPPRAARASPGFLHPPLPSEPKAQKWRTRSQLRTRNLVSRRTRAVSSSPAPQSMTPWP